MLWIKDASREEKNSLVLSQKWKVESQKQEQKRIYVPSW